MNIDKALEIFGIKSVDELERHEITKKYRKLMKKHHPDLYRASAPDKVAENEEKAKEINNAYNELLRALEQLTSIKQWKSAVKQSEVFAIIPFDKLVSLYDGENIELQGKNGSFTLTSGNIRANRIIIDIQCKIVINGIEYTFSALRPWKYQDEYEVCCDVPVVDNNPLDICIQAYNKNLDITLSSDRTRLKLKYKNNVYIVLDINKIIIQGDKDE